MRELPEIFLDLIEKDGWQCRVNKREGAGFTQMLEKDGLRLSYSGDPSGLYRIVASERGGWGYLEEIMTRIGLVPAHDMQDFRTVAQQATLAQTYLDSSEWKADVRRARHLGMERLREFQRSIGAEQSWLADEECDSRTAGKGWISQAAQVPAKYWIVALIALVFLITKFAYAEN